MEYMKRILNNMLDFFGFKTSKFIYEFQRWRQVKSLNPNLNHPKYKDILHTLNKDGIFLIENFISKEDCNGILNELDTVFQSIKNGIFSGDFQYNDDQLIRISNTDEVSHLAKKLFFEHPFLDELAKAYIDPRAYSYRREAELRDNTELAIGYQQADIYHFDDWRMRFKFFLYLTDVNVENAPFVFWKGSHKDATWKAKKNYEYHRDGENGAYGHYHPQELRALRKIIPFNELICTGKAGTLIIADFRGLHKGTPLKSGRRVLLNSTYGI